MKYLLILPLLFLTSCTLFTVDAGKGINDAVGKVGDGTVEIGKGLTVIGDKIKNNVSLTPFPPAPDTRTTTKPILSSNPDGTFVVSGEFVENSVKYHQWYNRVVEWREKNIIP